MEDSAQFRATPTIELHGDEFWPLSGKPFFDIILTKSHVKPIYEMEYLKSKWPTFSFKHFGYKLRSNLFNQIRKEIPAKLDPVLPAGASVPMVLSFGDKSWEMTYNEIKLVDRHLWRAFVDDNSLKAGDGCIFELTRCDSTKVVFKVQILRGDIPAELVEKYPGEAEKPIII